MSNHNFAPVINKAKNGNMFIEGVAGRFSEGDTVENVTYKFGKRVWLVTGLGEEFEASTGPKTTAKFRRAYIEEIQNDRTDNKEKFLADREAGMFDFAK